MPSPSKTARALASQKESVPAAGSLGKTINVGLNLTLGSFPDLLYANRIGLESIGLHSLVHFGTISDSAGTLSQFAAIFDRAMVQTNFQEWSEFLARNPPSASAVADFSFRCSPNILRSVPVVSVAMWAAVSDQGELRLYSISMGESLAAQQEGGGSISAQAVALVRMPRELQTHLLATLLNKHRAQD